MALVINFVAFQIGWLSAVTSAASQVPLIGLTVMAAAIALHLSRVARPSVEFRLLLVCAAIGAVFDSLLVYSGWVAYPSGYLIQGAAPYWIVAMWMLFATTLNVSMRWLRGRFVLAALFGLSGGPLAYFTGEKLDGIVLVDFQAAMLALGIGWAIIMPVLLWISVRLDGTAGKLTGVPQPAAS